MTATSPDFKASSRANSGDGITRWIKKFIQTSCGVIVISSTLYTAAMAQQEDAGKSGLPLPRFVSPKSDQVNMRVGPGRQYKVEWKFVKPGLPVEVIREFDNWRKIRDAEGTEGWVYHTLLSGRRTALVAPWNATNRERKVNLYHSNDPNSALAATMEPGAIVRVESCETSWCHVSARYSKNSEVEGYVMQDQLWGVYPDEEIEG